MHGDILVEYEKLEKDGKVAVLYSPGFGAGWHTWNDHEGLVFDREIVEAVLRNDLAAVEMIAERKYPGGYWGGARDLTVTWLPRGAVFEIEEYDGSESIHVIGSRTYLTA